MKEFDAICIGEIIVDFISQEFGKNIADVSIFSKFAGGAPANVAMGMAKLGLKVAFSGRVGKDPFGDFLANYLSKNEINTKYIIKDNMHKTRLAFVGIGKNGERSFEFWEREPADSFISSDDITDEFINSARLIHFGSLPLCNYHSREEIFNILDRIDQSSTFISFDLNYREPLWKSTKEAREVLKKFISKSQIIKLTEEEANIITEEGDLETAARKLLCGIVKLIAITRGEKGSFIMTPRAKAYIPAFKITLKDTTGCGDAFLSKLLTSFLKQERLVEEYDEDDLYQIGKYANASGAIIASKIGATSFLPTEEEIKGFLREYEKCHSRSQNNETNKTV
jgi:fructokinase